MMSGFVTSFLRQLLYFSLYFFYSWFINSQTKRVKSIMLQSLADFLCSNFVSLFCRWKEEKKTVEELMRLAIPLHIGHRNKIKWEFKQVWIVFFSLNWKPDARKILQLLVINDERKIALKRSKSLSRFGNKRCILLE